MKLTDTVTDRGPAYIERGFSICRTNKFKILEVQYEAWH
jgi:hypothetical protein